ncbi:MAG TPA: hypothetical protein VFB66_29135 [Tepidisphaeraceae bacterium]|nr:hypothetical protein [Tepidisphaeraceae bacterium]
MDKTAVAEQPQASGPGGPLGESARAGGSTPTAPDANGKSRRGRRRPPGPIGWAAFLAASWTWCIGMFLPVLMIRDYGVWGWFVFAVPNVLGAAAMGWVLRTADDSRAMQQTHLAACRWFSLVTLTFHFYFIVGPAARVLGPAVIPAAFGATLLMAFVYRLRERRMTVLAGAVLGVSVLAMFGLLALRGTPQLPPPGKERIELLWLAPVTIFGFLLGPYLDLTFHRARQSTSRAGGRTAFGLGFGVFFLLMIVFTAAYSPPLIQSLAEGISLQRADESLAWVLMVHVALQTAFTVAAHAAELGTEPSFSRWRGVIVALAIGLIAALLCLFQWQFPAYRRLTTAEMIYRAFMAFYGLIFPGYAWLFIVPRWVRGVGRVPGPPPSRGQIIYFTAVMILAAPLYWMGFIEGRMVWLVPGLLLVMLSRFLLPKPPVPSTNP